MSTLAGMRLRTHVTFVLLFLWRLSSASAGRVNHCGTPLSSGYKTYINNQGFELPFDKAADIVLGPEPYIVRYKNYFTEQKFEQYLKSISPPQTGPWIELGDGLLQRNVSYEMTLPRHPSISRVNIQEVQTAIYRQDMVKLNTRAICRETGFLREFDVTVELCITHGTLKQTNVQVDAVINYHTFEARRHAQQIHDYTQNGLTINFEALSYLLQKLETYHFEDPYQLNVTPFVPGNAVPHRTTTTPRTDLNTTTTLLTSTLATARRRNTWPFLLIFGLLFLVAALLGCLCRCCKKSRNEAESRLVRYSPKKEVVVESSYEPDVVAKEDISAPVPYAIPAISKEAVVTTEPALFAIPLVQPAAPSNCQVDTSQDAEDLLHL